MATTDTEKNKPGLEKMLLSLVMIVVLALGSVWSAMQFLKIQKIVSGEYQYMPDPPANPPSAEAETEVSGVKEVHSALDSVSEARRQAMQSAILAEATGTYPIASAQVLLASMGGAVAVVPGELPIEEVPPPITVRAVMALNSTTIATIDVADEQGKIVRPGTYFDGGNGRIMTITAGGIKYKWKNKLYEVKVNP